MSLLPNVAIVTVIDDDGNTLQQVLRSDIMSFEEGISTSGDFNINVSGSGNYIINVGGQELLRISPDNLITCNGDVFIDSNLIVQGTTTTLNVQDLAISDNIILLTSGTIGSPVLDSGLEVDRGIETNAQFLWDEVNNYWVAGTVGNLYKIITESNLNISLEDYLSISGGTLTGFLTLNADPTAPLHAVTKQYVDNQGAEDISITTTGNNFIEAGVSGTNLQDAISDVIDAIAEADSRRAVNYVFTTGQSGEVLPYAETKSNTYNVVSQLIFQGTSFLEEPSLAQVIISSQAGTTGTVRLYDATNAVEIATGTISSPIMQIVDMTVVGSWPTSQAILEIQSRTSQNNRWTRTATLSLRWN